MSYGTAADEANCTPQQTFVTTTEETFVDVQKLKDEISNLKQYIETLSGVIVTLVEAADECLITEEDA